MLFVSASLTSLNLSENYGGPELGIAMAEALKVNASLTKLDVTYNGIKGEVEEALREAVKGRDGFYLQV